MSSGWFSRRELIGLFGAGAVAASKGVVASGGRGRVGLSRIQGGGKLSREEADRAVKEVVMAATGVTDPRRAVQVLFKPADTVGIKLNCLAGPSMSPRPEVVLAFARLLVAGGLDAHRIILFERSSRELRRAGYRDCAPFQCEGIDNDYDRKIATSGDIGSLYARLVTTRCTALVSFGVLKDHDLAGVSGGMKNWYGVIHNPNKYHDNNCDPFVADVVRHPHIRDKIRLTLLDGGTAQYDGGPAARPSATWPLGLLVASRDPVAVDAWGWRTIDGERVRRKLPSLEAAGRLPRWIGSAARYGLGEGDPDRITEVKAWAGRP